MFQNTTAVARPHLPSQKPTWVGAHLVIALVCSMLPLTIDASGLSVAIEVMCYITLALMWNLLAGYAGLMSIGQQLFVGLGAYTLFVLAIYSSLPLIMVFVLAGLIPAVVALPAIWLCMRLQGPYFAISTWVIADAVMLIFSKLELVGGASGLSLPIPFVRDIAESAEARAYVFYALAAGLMLLSTLVAHTLLRSSAGLALTAIRDNEEAASSIGVNPKKTKMGIFVLAAFINGLAGAVLFLQKLRISPSAAFDLGDFTATVIFIVVIGGIGHLEGAFVGAAVFFILRALFSDLGATYLIMLGSIAIGAMFFVPRGIWGRISDKYDVAVFQARRIFKSKQS